MVGNPHLTAINLQQLATHPGQAHFAIDLNHTCRECFYWANQRGERTKYELKPARCRKTLESMSDPPPIPHSAIACRHFQASPNPPEI